MRTLFVTVGTTEFPELVSAICTPSFIRNAISHDCNRWIIQYGSSDPEQLNSLKESFPDIDLEIFSYKTDLGVYFAEANVIISHGGSGSILDAIRGPLFGQNLEKKKVSLIVVPNRNLLDDHQMDLLRELGTRKIATVCGIESLHLIFENDIINLGLPSPDLEVIESMLN